MQDWSKYIEVSYKEEALPELLEGGYRVVKDEYAFYGSRFITVQKDDITAHFVCVPYDMDDFLEKENSDEVYDLDDVDWWVDDVVENGKSFNDDYDYLELRITLEPIDNTTIENVIKESENKGFDKEQTFIAIVQPWMDAINRYLLWISNSTGSDGSAFLSNLRDEPDREDIMANLSRSSFMELCQEKQVECDFTISETELLKNLSGRQTVASFKVEDSELVIEETLNENERNKGQLVFYPNAKDRRFHLEMNAPICLRALVGYLKQMPELCRQMDEFAQVLKTYGI